MSSTTITAPAARRARRMDISEVPPEGQHFRNDLMPTVQQIATSNGVHYVATVMRRDCRGYHILWSDMGASLKDRDEALEIACLAADRFVVAAYLDSLGFISVAPATTH